MKNLEKQKCSYPDCKEIPVITLGIMGEKKRDVCFHHWTMICKRWLKGKVDPL